MQNANEDSFYFEDGISGVDQGNAIEQEILQGIEQRQVGLE